MPIQSSVSASKLGAVRQPHSGTSRALWRNKLLPRALVMMVALPLLVVGVSAADPDNEAAAIVLGKEINLPAAGPLGAVTVVGDSVLLGSALWGPTLPDQLQASGWGPIRFRAAVGYRAGPPTSSLTAGWWVNSWRASGWDAPNVIVNLGANDSGICQTDINCSRRRILDLVETIGPNHQIWWPMVTRAPGHGSEAVAWNTALQQIAAERSDFFTWDWPTAMTAGQYVSSDNTHLTGDGYRRRSVAMSTLFTNAVARSTRVGGDEAIPPPASNPSTYRSITPTRVVDTRLQPSERKPAGAELAVNFGALIDPGASAVAVNLTAADPSAAGYLAGGPCGSPIEGSVVNFQTGVSRGGMGVIALNGDEEICVFNSAETDIIVDIQGVFREGEVASGFNPLSSNKRILDTRATGRREMLVVDTPTDAIGVALNLTAVNATAPGWLQAVPCGSETEVSNINFLASEAVAGSAFVLTSPDNTVCIRTSVSVDVVVDLTGTFNSRGLSFVPVHPTRMLDTRNAIGGWSPIHGVGQTLDVRVAPSTAAAVTGTVTMVAPVAPGYMVGHSCGALPPTSSVNAASGQVLANAITTGVSDSGQLCVHSSSLTHSLFDVTGWWISV